jgi:hypothetical protein
MAQEWNSPSGTPTQVPNYLVPAIISLLCCWPLAIVAIIFAAQVNGKVAAGDIQGAMDSSKKAKMFSYIAIGCGLALGIVYAILFALGMAGGMMGSS